MMPEGMPEETRAQVRELARQITNRLHGIKRLRTSLKASKAFADPAAEIERLRTEMHALETELNTIVPGCTPYEVSVWSH